MRGSRRPPPAIEFVESGKSDWRSEPQSAVTKPPPESTAREAAAREASRDSVREEGAPRERESRESSVRETAAVASRQSIRDSRRDDRAEPEDDASSRVDVVNLDGGRDAVQSAAVILRKELARLSHQAAAVEKSLNDQRRERIDVLDRLERTTAHALQLEGKLSQAEADATQLRAMHEASLLEVRKVRSERDALERELASSKGTSEELTHARAEADKQRALAEEAQRSAATLEAELSEVRKRQFQEALRVTDKETEVSTFRERFERATAELTQAKAEVDRVRAELATTRDEVEKTRRDLTTTREEIELVRRERDDARSAQSALSVAESELASVRGAVTEARAEVDRLEADGQQVRRERDEQARRATSAEAALSEAESTILGLHRQLDTTVASLRQTEERAAAAEMGKVAAEHTLATLRDDLLSALDRVGLGRIATSAAPRATSLAPKVVLVTPSALVPEIQPAEEEEPSSQDLDAAWSASEETKDRETVQSVPPVIPSYPSGTPQAFAEESITQASVSTLEATSESADRAVTDAVVQVLHTVVEPAAEVVAPPEENAVAAEVVAAPPEENAVAAEVVAAPPEEVVAAPEIVAAPEVVVSEIAADETKTDEVTSVDGRVLSEELTEADVLSVSVSNPPKPPPPLPPRASTVPDRHSSPAAEPPAHASVQPPAHASVQPPAHASAQPPAHASAQPPAHASVQPPAHASAQPPAHASVQPPAHGSVQPPAPVSLPPPTLSPTSIGMLPAMPGPSSMPIEAITAAMGDPESARVALEAARAHPEWLSGAPPEVLITALARVDYDAEGALFELARMWDREHLCRVLLETMRAEHDPKLREHGAWLLKHLAAPSAWRPLAEMARSEKEAVPVRRWLLEALERLVTGNHIGWSELDELVMMMAVHPDATLRDGAVGILSALPLSQEKRRLLVEILRSDDDEVVLASTVHALANVTPIELDPTAVERLLDHPSPRVQRSVRDLIERARRDAKDRQ